MEKHPLEANGANKLVKVPVMSFKESNNVMKNLPSGQHAHIVFGLPKIHSEKISKKVSKNNLGFEDGSHTPSTRRSKQRSNKKIGTGGNVIQKLKEGYLKPKLSINEDYDEKIA